MAEAGAQAAPEAQVEPGAQAAPGAQAEPGALAEPEAQAERAVQVEPRMQGERVAQMERGAQAEPATRAYRSLPTPPARSPSRVPLLTDRRRLLQLAQVAPLQVNMVMARQRMRVSEKYGKSYLCLLQNTIFAELELPLRVKDIPNFTMQNIAFLSGGRGKDNAWIITFPENYNFRCIPEDVIAKVLIYLTSLARQNGSDSRFTLILDRRSDTWSSLKLSLQKIAVSFPGNLHLILVLRPNGFLQRTVTGIGFRFHQDDFMMKLPVVVLSSVSGLLKYIDRKQLTPELGGTMQYNHREWIIFRNAIENFALTVKEMAQMLQSFGTELAETELPDDISGVEELLGTRAERYHVLKNEITAVTNEGTILLTNLEEPGPQEVVRRLEHRHQTGGEWQTIKKLLTQVHDMETAFDGFWEKHKQKMEQYLQLWKFEQDFQKLINEIELLLNQQAELGDVSGNIAQIRQKMRMLDSLEEKSQNLLSKTRFVILHGHRLASNHHYALDLICQRCNELRYLTDILGNEIKAKQLRLSKVFKMHKLLQQARQCCDEGESLIVNHEIDNLQSKEDAEKALQDIENFMDMSLPFINYDTERLQYEFDTILSPELKIQVQSIQLKLASIRSAIESQQAGFRNLEDTCMGPLQLVVPGTDHVIKSTGPFLPPKYAGKPWRKNQSNLKMEVVQDKQEKTAPSQPPTLEHDNTFEILQNHVLNELIQSERVYVRELFTALLGYRAEMDNPGMYALMPALLRKNKDVLFGNMAEIYAFHKEIFMSSLDHCQNAPEHVGRCFLERKKEFQMYAKYCLNKPRSEKIWKKCSECAFFQECQKKLQHRLGLDSYLLKPVQRITKYQLLLKDLLKYSKDCEGTEQLKEALDSMLELLKSVNDSMHQIAVTGYDGNLNDLGKMIMQGPFSVWMGHRKGATKMKDLARFKPMQRVLFLYEKGILFCKKRMEGGEGSERLPSYSFKKYLDINEVGITEYVKGDGRKFELWGSGKEDVYILQAPNMDVKMGWLKEIRNILLDQQEFFAVKKREQQNQMAGQGLLSLKQNEKQKGSSGITEATASIHVGAAAAETNEGIMPVQAEASRVCTGMPSSAETSEGPQQWSREMFYSAYTEYGEDRPQMISSCTVKLKSLRQAY